MKSTSARTMGAGLAGHVATLTFGIVLALLLVGLARVPAAGSPDFAAIDEYVKKQMDETRMPGVALGIVKGDTILHLKGFGEADDSGRAVTAQTPFIIGSMSKSFTALAIMQLVEDGKVELDAPVKRYLPWFRVATPGASSRITVRNLLNQTSGLSAKSDAHLLREGDGKSSLEKAVRSLSTVELDRPVGKGFEYANLNYTVLGMIVQSVSGESYERYVKDHILIPLDMRDSYMFVPEAEQHGLATGHQYWFGWPFSGGGIAESRAGTPSGYISSTARDMSHYLIAQLNDGRYERAQILSPEGIAELHRGTANMHGGSYYAMGWVESELGGVPLVWHDGDTGDFHATMILVPQRGWGVVVLMNGSNHLRIAGMDGIANGVVSLLLGRQPPPEPFEQAQALLFAVLVVVVLQILGIVWSVVLLRRWRTRPARRPRGVIRIALHIVPPLTLNLIWAFICLVALPQFSQTTLRLMVLSDNGLVQVLSGSVALLWGVILRPGLMLRVFRKGGTPEESGTPPRKSDASARA